MDDLRSRIRDSDVIQIYEQFLRQSLVPIIAFTSEQLSVINAFLNLHNKQQLKYNEIDVMYQVQLFEKMKQFAE